MKFVYWLSCTAVFFYLKIFYRIKIEGTKNIPKGACLLASNHSSYLDPPIVAACCPAEMHFLARGTLFRTKISGWYLRSVNCHPVATDGDDVKSLRTVLKLLKEGKKVTIFPEGGRSSDGNWLPFKLGVAMLSLHANAPILPIVIEGASKVWGKRQKYPTLFGGHRLKVTFLPPIYPDQFQSLPKKEAQHALTDALYQEMLKAKTS